MGLSRAIHIRKRLDKRIRNLTGRWRSRKRWTWYNGVNGSANLLVAQPARDLWMEHTDISRLTITLIRTFPPGLRWFLWSRRNYSPVAFPGAAFAREHDERLKCFDVNLKPLSAFLSENGIILTAGAEAGREQRRDAISFVARLWDYETASFPDAVTRNPIIATIRLAQKRDAPVLVLQRH